MGEAGRLMADLIAYLVAVCLALVAAWSDLIRRFT